jgi:predicted nucleic acid-binding Zn ribbon protein
MKVRYCPECGMANPEEARYCGRCGALLSRPRRSVFRALLWGVLSLAALFGGAAAGYWITMNLLLPYFAPGAPPPLETPEAAPAPSPTPLEAALEETEAPTPVSVPPTLTPSPVPLPPSPTPRPVPPLAPPPRLAFVAGDVGRTDIYIAEADGSGIRCVVCQPSDDAEPGWSPDGKTLVYQSNEAGSYDLWVVDVETGVRRPLLITPDFDEREPDWSRDGRAILFQRNPRGTSTAQNGEICMLVLPDSVRCLGIWGRGPAWRPDGSGFAYMAERGLWHIFYYDFQTGSSYLISPFCSNGCRWPAWSPDGAYLVYHELVSPRDFRPLAIYSTVMDTEVNYRLLTTGDHPGRPSWSESGWIAMNTDRGIEIIRPDGTGRRVLIPRERFGVDIWAPAWSR